MGVQPHLSEAVPSAQHEDELAYRRYERSVMKMLSSRYASLDGDARREIYQEIWASVLMRQAAGVTIENLGAYLHGAADKVATKRLFGADARRRVSFDPTSPAYTGLADITELPEERVVALDEARRLRMLVSELDPAEQAVLKLRIDGGLEPAEVRERLGLSERQYRRLAERAGKALLGQFQAFDQGQWARGKRSLLCATVMGVASQRQRERARQLIAEDPCCRAMMTELRRLGDHAVALLPWPAATVAAGPAHATLGERMADLGVAVKERAVGLTHHAPGTPDPGRHERLTGTFADARRRAGELAIGAKQHATGAYLRTGDPTPLAGARPGAVGVVLASCLAVGSGVTYCASTGTNPIRDLAGLAPAKTSKPVIRHKRSAKPRATPAHAPVTVPVAPAATRTPPTTPSPQPQAPTSTPSPAPRPVRPPASSNQEFDPGAGSSASATPHQSAPATPAPAAGGEFSGP